MSKRNKPTKEEDRRLQQWLQRKKKESKGSLEIGQLPKGEPAPLSLGQQRLWLLQQLHLGNPFYHHAEVYGIKGNIRENDLIETFRKVVERHDILRTTFLEIDGQAFQQINIEPRIDLAHFDLQQLPPMALEERAKSIILAESTRPFDLELGPLVRVSLLQIAEQEIRLIVTMHHMITDKWSMRLLREEWARAYRGETSMPPLEFQYADYSWWQRNQPIDSKHLAYWEQKLAGDLPILTLPTDHPRPQEPSFQGALYEQAFSPKLYHKLKVLCKQANTTMFVMLLCVYKVLLYRYSGQTDLIVGAPVTNRSHTSLENLIGFFNDTIVLRSDLSGNPKFMDLVTQVRDTVLEAFTHRNVPFESLVKALKPDRFLSTNPLFQVMFIYHKVPPTPTFSPDLDLEYKPLDVGVSKFDLTMYFSEEEDLLSTNIEYTSDLFEADTIERMGGHLRTLMEEIVENPQQHVGALPMLTEAEREQIVITWNDTDAPLPESSCIHHLIEAQALNNPDTSAVVFQGKVLTYEILNQRANNIAQRLLAANAGPGSRVGLCTDRSHELIIGILGILKAGAAYVPLDPEYPMERIQYMIQDASMSLILTQSHLTDLFHNIETAVFTFDAGSTNLPNQEASFTPPAGSNTDLAYVIYTSGSTGQPKGVPVSHQNLLHATSARFAYYPKQPGVFLLLSSFGFDSSVAGIFWSLCSGGTLVLAERRIEQDIDGLARLIADQSVTHTLLLPSLYDLLLQYAQPELLATLNTVIVAGEACSSAVCRRHFETLPHTNLFNEYGPTEATVWCTVHHIQPENGFGRVPIGRPIANTKQYILDEDLQPVPIGVVGELYIGGSGVVQGYLNNPEMAAARFVSSPFDNDPNARLYHTGDLARYQSDGVIEFLGRADNQVKIRGYRIEPEEIQEVLMSYQGITEAVVLTQTKAKETNLEEVDLGHLEAKLQSLNPEVADHLLRSVEATTAYDQSSLTKKP